MNEERKEILRMLAEKIITVDDAEKLLKALDEGERRRAEADRSRPRTFHHFIRPDAFTGVGQALAGIGPMVHEAVHEAMEGVQNVIVVKEDEEGAQELTTAGMSFEIEAGSGLLVRNKGFRRSRGGNVIVRGIEGPVCRYGGTGAGGVKVYRMGDRYILSWPEDDLEVDVPATVSNLTVLTKGGDMTIENLGCRLDAKTMGGDIEASGLKTDFSVTTMGGDIRIEVPEGWQGRGAGSSMGGDIEVAIPKSVPARISASTMGGSIEIPDSLGKVVHTKSSPGVKAEAVVGPEKEPASEIRLKSMGGDIELGGK